MVVIALCFGKHTYTQVTRTHNRLKWNRAMDIREHIGANGNEGDVMEQM